MDLATLIKPILTTGQLRVVGSTTHEEFKHIEKDRALARRLQKITVDEPSHQETVKILQGLRSRYEAHHRVKFTDESIEAAAKLAARHLRDYKLPDSAIDVLDETGARTRLARGIRADGAEPDEITPHEIEEVIARMARIPAKQASASDRDRLRTLEESSSARKRPSRPSRTPSNVRARAWASLIALLAASSSPDRPVSARRSWPSSWRCTWAMSSCATT